MSEAPRELFGTRLGFVLAAAGSAIGLGNMWRFSYQAAEGAFLEMGLVGRVVGSGFFVALVVAGLTSSVSLRRWGRRR